MLVILLFSKFNIFLTITFLSHLTAKKYHIEIHLHYREIQDEECHVENRAMLMKILYLTSKTQIKYVRGRGLG